MCLMDTTTVFYAHALFRRCVHTITVVKNRRPSCHMVRQHVLSPGTACVWLRWSVKLRWTSLSFFSIFSPVAQKYTSVLTICEMFILVPGLLISLLLLFYSFDFLFVFVYFNYSSRFASSFTYLEFRLG